MQLRENLVRKCTSDMSVLQYAVKEIAGEAAEDAVFGSVQMELKFFILNPQTKLRLRVRL